MPQYRQTGEPRLCPVAALFEFFGQRPLLPPGKVGLVFRCGSVAFSYRARNEKRNMARRHGKMSRSSLPGIRTAM